MQISILCKFSFSFWSIYNELNEFRAMANSTSIELVAYKNKIKDLRMTQEIKTTMYIAVKTSRL